MSNGSPNYNWAKYKETIDFGQREVTEEPLAQGNSAYSKTMTINRILESDEILRQVFIFLSLCDSEPLPIKAAVNFVKARTSRQTEELIRAKILNSSLVTWLYSEDGAPGYVRVHKVVHEVLRRSLDSDFTDKVECVSVAIHVFHSVTAESECNHLNESGHVCIMLRRITAHCKVLHAILTNMFAGKDVLMNELTAFLPPENFVSWLCSTASLCCDLSNPSRAILFSGSACDFIHYVSTTREGHLVKAGVFAVHGIVLSMSCQYKSSLSAHTEAANIYRAVYGE